MRLKPMKDIKIRTKLVLLGTVCLLGLAILGKESISTASRIKQAGDEVSAVWMNAVIVAEELNTVTSDYRIKESRHAITTDPELMKSLEEEMERLRDEIEGKFEEYRRLPTWEADQQIITEAEIAWKGYLEYSEMLIETSKGNDREKATAMMMGHSQELFDRASGLFLEAVAVDKRAVEVQRNQAELIFQRMSWIKLLVIGMVSIFMIGLIWYLIRAIERPAAALVDAARRVTNGNLDVRLVCRSRDELGILEDAMNQMIQRLEDIVKDEIQLFRETGSENFQARSSCEQAYRGDFAPILYGFTSLQSRLREIKRRQGESEAALEAELEEQKERAADLRVEREHLAEQTYRLADQLGREKGKVEHLTVELEKKREQAAGRGKNTEGKKTTAGLHGQLKKESSLFWKGKGGSEKLWREKGGNGKKAKAEGQNSEQEKVAGEGENKDHRQEKKEESYHEE